MEKAAGWKKLQASKRQFHSLKGCTGGAGFEN